MKRRILMFLTVVALMVAMLAMSVAPAFAITLFRCTNPSTGLYVEQPATQIGFLKASGFTECVLVQH